MSDLATASLALTDRQRLTGMIAAIVTISIAAMGFGHSIPLFSLLLKSCGASDSVIGWNVASGALAIMAMSPFFPNLIARIGLKLFITSCIILMIVPYWGIYLVGDTIWAWFPLRIIFSIAASGMFAASELWINIVAEPEKRGKVLGMYGTALSLGFAAGPFALSMTGTEGRLPFIIGIIIFALAIIPVASTKAPKVITEKSKWSFFPLLMIAPATFLANAVFGGTEGAILTFLPITVVENGLTERAAALVITVFVVGAISFQYILGRFADDVGKMKMLIFCTTTALIGAVLLPFATDHWILLYILLFILGGVITGLSTLGLVVLGDRFEHNQMAAANTGFVFMYGFGSLVGPSVAGTARDLTPTFGLPMMLIAAFGAYLVLLIVRRKAKTP